MKFLNYIKTLFIPGLMSKRKNINVLVSFLIMLLISYLIAIPYISTFKKNAYGTFRDSPAYTFNVLDNEQSQEVAFTEEEKTLLGDRYIYISENELKNIGFKEKNNQVIIPSEVQSIKELPYNQKEYLLKREVFKVDNAGNRTGESDIYYIHIAFDMFESNETYNFDIRKKFDSLYTEDTFNHYLLVFYRSGFAYRNKYMIDNNRKSYAFDYSDIAMDFSEMDSLDYITKNLSIMLIPQMRMQFTFNTFIYAVLAPIFFALLAYIFIRNKHSLITYKHYYNIAALASIPVSIIFFILEWIPLFIQLGILEFYVVIFAIYYFSVLSIINRRVEID